MSSLLSVWEVVELTILGRRFLSGFGIDTKQPEKRGACFTTRFSDNLLPFVETVPLVSGLAGVLV